MVRSVEEAANRVQDVLREDAISPADTLFDMDGFRRKFGKVVQQGDSDVLTDTDARILLKFLERDRKSVVIKEEVEFPSIVLF